MQVSSSMSARNSYGWPSSNVKILIIYVSNVSDVGCLRISTLMICVAHYSSNFKLISAIGGGLIHACTSLFIHGALFMVGCLDIVGRSVVTSHIATLQSAMHV